MYLLAKDIRSKIKTNPIEAFKTCCELLPNIATSKNLAILNYLKISWRKNILTEIGYYLLFAQHHGFLSNVVNIINKLLDIKDVYQLKKEAKNPYNELYKKFNARVDEIKALYFFVEGLGYNFIAHSVQGSNYEIDGIVNKLGENFTLEVKSSGKYGNTDTAQIFTNSIDDGAEINIKCQLDKGAKQLKKISQEEAYKNNYNIIVLCPQVHLNMGVTDVLEEFLFGDVINYKLLNGPPVLSTNELNRGQFIINPDWKHISAVVMIDVLYGVDYVECEGKIKEIDLTTYKSVVYLNPYADKKCDPSLFPYSRVVNVENEKIKWYPDQPKFTCLPDDTRILPIEQTQKLINEIEENFMKNRETNE